jgi:hypothetical protein
MGVRYVRLNRQTDAAAMFRTAQDGAPADAALSKLARQELERMQKK